MDIGSADSGGEVSVMCCVACAAEMRLVGRVPDQSMMVTGHELHTLECPGCGSREQRLVSARRIDEMHVERMQTLQPALLVLAATGGLERLVTSALATAGLPVVVVNPRQARAGARATGQ